MGDGDSKIDAKEDTGAAHSEAQVTGAQGAHLDLPLAPTPSVGKVEEPASAAAVPMSCNELPGLEPGTVASESESHPLARLSPVPDREANRLEQSHETVIESAMTKIEALRRHVEELAKRVGDLESEKSPGGVDPRTSHAGQGRAAALAEVVVSFDPQATEETGDQPEATGNANATLRVADTAERLETCVLTASMWDSPVILGRRDARMGYVVTLWALLVLLINTVLQLTIAVIVVKNMGNPEIISRTIEDMWCASEPRFATVLACNLLGRHLRYPVRQRTRPSFI